MNFNKNTKFNIVSIYRPKGNFFVVTTKKALDGAQTYHNTLSWLNITQVCLPSSTSRDTLIERREHGLNRVLHAAKHSINLEIGRKTSFSRFFLRYYHICP